MLDTVDFTLFGAGYFYIPVNVLELCSRTHLSYLELVWSLQSCFESLLGGTKAAFWSGTNFPPQRTLSPSEQPSLSLWTVGTGAVSRQVRAWGCPCSSGSHGFLIPSCQVALRWRPWSSLLWDSPVWTLATLASQLCTLSAQLTVLRSLPGFALPVPWPRTLQTSGGDDQKVHLVYFLSWRSLRLLPHVQCLEKLCF